MTTAKQNVTRNTTYYLSLSLPFLLRHRRMEALLHMLPFDHFRHPLACQNPPLCRNVSLFSTNRINSVEEILNWVR